MTIEQFPPARMRRAQLEQLPKYDVTLPTGTAEGKRWRRAWPPFGPDYGAEWVMGQYGKCRDGTNVPIFWRRVIITGEPARWPREISVPLRVVAR